jgi:hypothetical protein
LSRAVRSSLQTGQTVKWVRSKSEMSSESSMELLEREELTLKAGLRKYYKSTEQRENAAIG